MSTLIIIICVVVFIAFGIAHAFAYDSVSLSDEQKKQVEKELHEVCKLKKED